MTRLVLLVESQRVRSGEFEGVLVAGEAGETEDMLGKTNYEKTEISISYEPARTLSDESAFPHTSHTRSQNQL